MVHRFHPKHIFRSFCVVLHTLSEDTPVSYTHLIHIDGDYSTKTPGTYTMKYYATDKNGNASNVETFTLTVE